MRRRQPTSDPFTQPEGGGLQRDATQSELNRALSYNLSYNSPRFSPRGGGGGAFESGYNMVRDIQDRNREEEEKAAYADLLDQALGQRKAVQEAGQRIDNEGLPSFGLPDQFNPFMEMQKRAKMGDPAAIAQMEQALGSALEQVVPQQEGPDRDVLEMAYGNKAISGLIDLNGPEARASMLEGKRDELLANLQARMGSPEGFGDPLNNQYSAINWLRNSEYKAIGNHLASDKTFAKNLARDDFRAAAVALIPHLVQNGFQNLRELTYGVRKMGYTFGGEGKIQPGQMASSLISSGKLKLNGKTYTPHMTAGTNGGKLQDWSETLRSQTDMDPEADEDAPKFEEVSAYLDLLLTGAQPKEGIKFSKEAKTLAQERYTDLIKSGVKLINDKDSSDVINIDGSGSWRDVGMTRRAIDSGMGPDGQPTVAKQLGLDMGEIAELHSGLERAIQAGLGNTPDLLDAWISEKMVARGIESAAERDQFIEKVRPEILQGILEHNARADAERDFDAWATESISLEEFFRREAIGDFTGETKEKARIVNAGDVAEQDEIEQELMQSPLDGFEEPMSGFGAMDPDFYDAALRASGLHTGQAAPREPALEELLHRGPLSGNPYAAGSDKK